MLQRYSLNAPEMQRAVINHAYRANEFDVVSQLIAYAELNEEQLRAIKHRAKLLVEQVRQLRKNAVGVDSFLNTYSLSTQEGIALMCLAEALLRVPDQSTVDKLIRDKLTGADWRSKVGQSDSFFINATTWALVLTGKVLKREEEANDWSQILRSLVNRSGEPFVRTAVAQAMKILSRQFVMGRTIDEAIKRSKKFEPQGYRYSFDMLGEAALTEEDANRYYDAYIKAITSLGQSADINISPEKKSNISVKLSALHPRYQETFAPLVRHELGERLLKLAQLAKEYNVGLTVDAEESERLDLSLDIISDVYLDNSLAQWDGFGLAVQSYQKRAFHVIDWVADLAKKGGRRIMVRLIKGAYWDSEIKKTQMQGLAEYPVFTRKVFTDLSFQACAKKILTYTDHIYPQFATHNAYSVAMILEMVGSYRDFEFQCLHGMGKELYEQIVPVERLGIPCRVYAPVGSHEELLPYLVRRLLENGANSSFVNRIIDESQAIDSLIEDTITVSKRYLSLINHNIALPWEIFLPERQNSRGIDWSDRNILAHLQKGFEPFIEKKWHAAPMLETNSVSLSEPLSIFAPQDTQKLVGQVQFANIQDVENAYIAAQNAFFKWNHSDVEFRASIIEKFADLLEEHTLEILALTCFEAGKNMYDGMAEIREAVDFCRYYAYQARQLMQKPMRLKGYTGETNDLSLYGRGIMVCISPWNFPLAIFVGQVVASLLTGNCVLAKPAEQTSMIAVLATELLWNAGVPKAVMQLLPGQGETIGQALIQDKRCAGVIFTGSTQTATIIQKVLANKEGPIVPLIAETGGMNAMIVDSSALLEQVTMDVLSSAFGSAGQRCSALRVLYIQKDVYPRFKKLLQGAMAQLRVGDPMYLTTDVGPVIDAEALKILEEHVNFMKKDYEVICEAHFESDVKPGNFIRPIAIEIPSISVLSKEVFGPILHVVTFEADKLNEVVNEINATGYGLTLGVQSRINETVEYIRKHAHVGNLYVNRNMIGAVVGLQPFGGEGLSGTGPKAGGPFYLLRLCHERTFTVDTTAAGGNASLMAEAHD
jgi:RHH-type transcriptional regulator, proline utilization regulon repressor / proline dehydrogenase / delta 1-pyrroline-5-carboxylate dehydrogenase